MHNIRRKNNIIIGSLLAVLLVMGIGYAAFASKLNINGTVSATGNWDIEITGIRSTNHETTGYNIEEPTYTKNTASFNTGLKSPGDGMVYEIEISNLGTIDGQVGIVSLDCGSQEAIYCDIAQSSDKYYDDNWNVNGNVEEDFYIWETKDLTDAGIIIEKGDKKYLYIFVYFYEDVTSMPDNLSTSINLTLNYVQYDGNGSAAGGSSDITTGPTMGGQSVEVVTTGDGLYADSTESGRYYYSGSSANNSIVFNGESYKILGIENDGRIKIIKMVSIGNQYWNTAGTNVWANSSLKSYLEETWLPTQESGEDYQYLSDTNEWYVGAVSSKSNIAANYTAEKKTVVNSAVGLISASEFLKSKYTGSTFLNVSSEWWLISPYASSSDYAWLVDSSSLCYGSLGSRAVFPVLYLKSSVSLTGSGTSTDPYCIKGSTCPKDLNFSQRTS